MKYLLLGLFSLGQLLTHAQTYQQIHEKAIVVDTHNDVLSSVTMKGLDFSTNLSGKAHSDLARFRKGGVDVQVFSIFCDDKYGRGSAFKYANQEIDSLYSMVARHPDKIMIVRNMAELDKALRLKNSLP
ncbi:MAG TPA: membrane dipeptidase [Puia sp.]|nr:membrane dipeptidase [Puia sp.]